MTDINQAARAAFVSVRGERPNAATTRATNEEPMPWDSDLADFLQMLKALEQEGYRVVPMKPTDEMVKGFWRCVEHGDEEAAFAEDCWRTAIAASPEIEI